MITNFITFDVEEWFHANYARVDFSRYDATSSNLESNVDRLIEQCQRHNIKSTCFILGDVAKNKPHVVKKLFDAGHEIASHGTSHKLIHPMTPTEFLDDLQTSTDRLEQITGQKVIGFRAPSWSLKQETLQWFYELLQQEGYRYSSSIYPGKNTHFGIEGANEKIHYAPHSTIIEIPQSVMSLFGHRLGYAGGGYLRFFPLWLIKKMIHQKNGEGKNVFLYLHPREIDPTEKRLSLGLIDSYFHYQGIDKTQTKLEALLQEFGSSFSRMDHHVFKILNKEITI